MSARRQLIVNADDFGLSEGVNRGIIEVYDGGIVTSASLMVRWPAAVEAAAYAREHPGLSLGLHFDLGEWAYDGGVWTPVYEVVPTDDIGAVEEEAAHQVAAFRRLVGREPTHIDSHQHVHRREPVRSVLSTVARQLSVPLRHYAQSVRYCGDFYGQTKAGLPLHEVLSVDSLIKTITSLPSGVTELACHPGFDEDLGSTYRGERAKEVRVLCDPQVRATVIAEGIELCSFADVTTRRLDLMPKRTE